MKPERVVAAALVVGVLASLGFIGAYGFGLKPPVATLLFALAAAALGFAAVSWVRLLSPARVREALDQYPSSEPERRAESAELAADSSELSRHRALARLLFAALAAFGLGSLVTLRSLGPAPRNALFLTKWRKGERLRREDGTFVHVDDLNVDSIVTVFPQRAPGDGQSQVALIRLPAHLAPPTRGYVAFSRLCTHAGCPVAIYRAAAMQLLCPCHQSVFDVLRDGAVVAGPADHRLPRLPIAIGADGFLHATGGFAEPVGPGFWERG